MSLAEPDALILQLESATCRYVILLDVVRMELDNSKSVWRVMLVSLDREDDAYTNNFSHSMFYDACGNL